LLLANLLFSGSIDPIECKKLRSGQVQPLQQYPINVRNILKNIVPNLELFFNKYLESQSYLVSQENESAAESREQEQNGVSECIPSTSTNFIKEIYHCRTAQFDII
jgi:succinate dehydrogenase/fumarate reductase-like Fe-S protein